MHMRPSFERMCLPCKSWISGISRKGSLFVCAICRRENNTCTGTVYIYIYMHIYVYIYIYTYTHTHIHIHVHPHPHPHPHARAHTQAHTQAHTHTHTERERERERERDHTHTHTHGYCGGKTHNNLPHILQLNDCYIHVHTYVRRYAYIYTHKYTLTNCSYGTCGRLSKAWLSPVLAGNKRCIYHPSAQNSKYLWSMQKDRWLADLNVCIHMCLCNWYCLGPCSSQYLWCMRNDSWKTLISMCAWINICATFAMTTHTSKRSSVFLVNLQIWSYVLELVGMSITRESACLVHLNLAQTITQILRNMHTCPAHSNVDKLHRATCNA